METLFIYLIKSSGLIGMFYLAYYFLLRKETFFNSNRWFLLAGLITSVILPLIVFTKIVWVNPIPTHIDWSQIPMTTNSVEKEAFEINWYLVFGIVYSIGILGFLLKFAFDFYSLSKVLKGKTVQKQSDFKFINVTENIAPFSYFDYIVYNSSLYSDTELKNILEHEKVHSAQNHTVDVLISRLFCVVFWFNPMVWLYKKAIVQNLEYIADSEASKIISDKKAYQMTLLKITTQENCVAITNHFYQSLIKKRIVMLNKNQSNKRNSWKYAVVLPVLGAFLFFFQVKVVAQEKAAPKQETETKSLTKTQKEIHNNGIKSNDTPPPPKVKQQLPPPPPPKVEKVKFAAPKVKQQLPTPPRPKVDKVKFAPPKVKQQELSSQLEKAMIIIDGNIAAPNYKIDDIPKDQIASINILKGKSAEEKYGEDAKYGAIEINTKEKNTKNESQQIKVVGYGKKKENTINGLKVSGFSSLDGTKPLIVVDGITKDPNYNMDAIPKEQIKKIDVLKGKIAQDKYGEKGKNGVIEIETK